MAWDSYEELKPEILMGRKLLGAAVRRARLRQGLSQRQLGWYVALDQTTISRLETAKLKGMRFSTLCRVIGTISRADAFELPDAPIRVNTATSG
jgi:transcriptional regulator with XRE-family HTH domain